MSINRGMDKGVAHIYIYTVEYYPAIKKNETMPSAATCAQPEITILSKVLVSQEEKRK